MGTPYVYRTTRWCSKDRKYVLSDMIDIGESSWDGIAKREYNSKFKLNPEEARYVATELWKIAENIDGKTNKPSVIRFIRKNTKRIAQQAKKEAEAC